MLRLTTHHLRKELEKKGYPETIGYITLDNKSGTIHLMKNNQVALIEEGTLKDNTDFIEVVLNELTINSVSI